MVSRRAEGLRMSFCLADMAIQPKGGTLHMATKAEEIYDRDPSP